MCSTTFWHTVIQFPTFPFNANSLQKKMGHQQVLPHQVRVQRKLKGTTNTSEIHNCNLTTRCISGLHLEHPFCGRSYSLSGMQSVPSNANLKGYQNNYEDNVSCIKSKVGDCSRGWLKGSLFNSYYIEVEGKALLLSLDCFTLSLICTL